MKPLAALAHGAWIASSLPAWQRFRRALRHPEETQGHILRQMLTANAHSAYGRAHGFNAIRSYQQFHARVPLIEYDALEPWIARLMQGEANVLTREPVTRLVPTSGSSGAHKLIPFTGALQNQFNAAIGPWMVDLCRQHPGIMFGPAYWSISPALPASGDEPSAVPIGFDDDSAYLGGFRQKLAESTFAAPSALRHVADVECSRYLTLLCLLRQPELRLISVWHPSFLTLLLDRLPNYWAELLSDLEHGGCTRTPALPTSVQPALAAPPQCQRAALLRRTGPENFRALWPHLKVVSSWADAQAAFPFARLQERLPDAVHQPKGLFATEGFITIPFRGLHPLAITSHFYEFADPRGALHRAHELRPGETYSVILTTAGGLWRYRLGDEVEVDGFVGATPSLRFVGRGGHVSDLCGEKIHERFVTKALAAACAATGFAPAFAMLAPETEPAIPPHYTLFVEGLPPADLLPALETELRRNPHYEWCRQLEQLGPLQCVSIHGDAYERYARNCVSLGQRLGEIKPASLSTRSDWRHRFSDHA